MLKVTESEYPDVVYMEVDGRVTNQDVEKADAFMKEHYGENAEINVLAYFEKLDNIDAGAMLKGMFVDAKHWNQYEKIALVADKDWLQHSASLVDLLPGIDVRQYNKAEIDEAWSWLRE